MNLAITLKPSSCPMRCNH